VVLRVTEPWFDWGELSRAVALLGWSPDSCAELRCLGNRNLGVKHGTVAGYFTDALALATAAAQWSGLVEGVYVVLNPVVERASWRCRDRVNTHSPKGTGTKDQEVLHRKWLLVDLDPVRLAGLSATDSEHEAALARAREVRDYLHSEGFGGLVLADSGNGGHVLVPFHFENDDASTERARQFLQRLGARFTDVQVKVDSTTFNAARLCKLYGTAACKGDHHPERNPHRLSRILEMDDQGDYRG
jgi:hypothetical protein